MYSFQVNKKPPVTNSMFQKIMRTLIGAFLILQTTIVWAEEVVWSGEKLLTSSFSLENGQTLRILPGTIVKFDARVSLYVGTIIAEGTQDNPILFTSTQDNRTALDEEQSKYINEWFGIVANKGSFKHVIIRYAGAGAYPGLLLTGPVTVDSSKIVYNRNAGIEIDTSENPIISNT